MTQFHIVPKQDLRSHDMTPECWCKPTLRSKMDAGNEVSWQHTHAYLPPPVMHGGLMYAGAWTLYSVNAPIKHNWQIQIEIGVTPAILGAIYVTAYSVQKIAHDAVNVDGLEIILCGDVKNINVIA